MRSLHLRERFLGLIFLTKSLLVILSATSLNVSAQQNNSIPQSVGNPSPYASDAFEHREVHAHFRYDGQSAETYRAQTYEALAGESLNCSRTLPPAAIAHMRSISRALASNRSMTRQSQESDNAMNHKHIPDEYLHNCLRAYPYNIAQFPLGFTNQMMNIRYTKPD